LNAEERAKYLETILQSTDGLMLLVKDLFELSGLEASESKPDMEEFAVDELLQDIYQKNMIIAGQKKIEFVFERNERLSIIKADIRMMEKVFQNLIDNAFKFTPESGKVSLMILQNPESFEISVADAGTGIDEKELENIFNRYHQIKRISDGAVKGFGLGLAIVKKIIDLHGFEIVVESEIGKGTRFCVKVPVKM
jgi:signal transduction histidine kinase